MAYVYVKIMRFPTTQFSEIIKIDCKVHLHHCVKSVHIRSYSGLHFPAFGLNTERYSVSLRIQSKCGKKRARITPNMDTFYAVHYSHVTGEIHGYAYNFCN